MSGGFFRGTSADQDTRFSNKQAKLMKSQKFAPELEHLVDMTKVKMDVMRPWIASRVTELLGFEDEVLINFIYGLLEGKVVNGKEIQISLTGFMEKNTGRFMKELWERLLSAQKNASGVPQQLLDEKEEETRRKKAETDRITNEIQRKKEKEGRELDQEKTDKMDGGVDNSRANNDALESSLRNQPRAFRTRSAADEKETNGRNGSRGRMRVSRSPHSLEHSPSLPRETSPRSISKSFSNSRSCSDETRRSRSISGTAQNRGCSISSEKSDGSPSRHSVSPRRRGSPRRSISPLRRRTSHFRRRSMSRPRRRSPSPIRRRFRTPMRRRSRSPVRRRSRSPVRRRSRSPVRRRSPTPKRRRSRSPVRQRSRSPLRYRSRSPLRYRSRSPLRYRSRSPLRYRSRSPIRHRPRSPLRRRSPSPIQLRSPSPGRPHSPSPGRRSPSPGRHRSPSPARRRSPFPGRRRYRRSPSTPRRRSPSSSWRRPNIPSRRKSPSPPGRRSSAPQELGSRSPIHHISPSPVRRRSPRRQRSPVQSPRDRIRTVEKHSPVRHALPRENSERPVENRKETSMEHRPSMSLRSPQRDSPDQNYARKNLPSITSPFDSPSSSQSPPALRKRSHSEDTRSRSPYESPVRQTKEQMIHGGRPSPTRKPIEHKHIPDSPQEEATNYSREAEYRIYKSSGKRSTHAATVDELKDPAEKAQYKDGYSRDGLSNRHSSGSKSIYDNLESRKNNPQTKSETRSREVHHSEVSVQVSQTSYKGTLSSEAVRDSYGGEGGYEADHKSQSHTNSAKGSGRHESDSLAKLSRKVEEQGEQRGSGDYSSESSDKYKTEVNEKRKQKRSKRQESDDGDSYDSRVDGRKDAKRRRKEEKRLRKEEKRKRREERRRRREERRAEKLKLKSVGTVSPSELEENHDGYASDGERVVKKDLRTSDNEEEEAESRKKKLEIELRNKALETLRAKKSIGH